MRWIDVGPRPTSRDELAAWYADVLEAQAASGLSVAEYAGRIGVSVPTLYQWRRRLGSQGHDGGNQARLVEVSVTSPTGTTDGHMIVRLCSGRRSIEVPRDFADDELRRLIAVVESC